MIRPTDERGQESPVTDTPQLITIGTTPGGYSMINDGPAEIFYRKKDPEVAMSGTAEEIIVAATIGGSRLKIGEIRRFAAGITLEVACATGLTATLRIAPGDAETGTGTLESILAALGGGDIGDAMDSESVDLDAGAAQEVIAAPAAGHQLWIYGYEIHANVQGSYQFLSDTDEKTGTMPVGAGGGMARDSKYPIFKCGTAEALNITAVTCAADGIVTYRDVTV